MSVTLYTYIKYEIRDFYVIIVSFINETKN